MLEIKNLNYSYQKTKVLNNVSFKIEDQEIVGILGPSGSGKTTLLKIMSHLETIKEGSYMIDDLWISKDGIKGDDKSIKLAMSELGVVFQQFNLFPHMSVLENVCLPLKLRTELNQTDIIKQATELLNELGLGERLNSYPHQISGGQQQRTAIARAMVLKPKILIIDEPTSSLDAATSQTVIQLLKQLHQNGLTLIVITHDLVFAKAICQRVIEIEAGIIKADCLADQYFI